MRSVLPADFLAAKAEQVRRRRADRDPRADQALRDGLAGLPAAPSLSDALRAGDRVAVIAEYKRRSPSAGVLAAGEDPVAVAAGYRAAGAAALSVLTDDEHFGGTLADLSAVASMERSVPVLRKDFVVDAGQLVESRLAGGSAALLIVGMLADRELADLLAVGAAAGLECLVEVHSEAELERAAGAGASLIGINNRDLRRLVSDLGVTDRLAPLAPAGAVVVSESGIRSPEDVARVRDAGAHAVLVGESLLRAPAGERGARLRELARVAR